MLPREKSEVLLRGRVPKPAPISFSCLAMMRKKMLRIAHKTIMKAKAERQISHSQQLLGTN